MIKFESPCHVCCHNTRNAMIAVSYFAKQVKKENPTMSTALLVAALNKLDEAIKRCAE